MSFHTKLLTYTKEETIRLLRASNLTSEYHIDQVLLTLHPDCLYIVLYTTRPDAMKQHLIENGFVPEISNNPSNTVMLYKDIIDVKVMTDHGEYDIEKIRNFKISSINLKHVVKQMAKNGYELQQMYTGLEKLATYK